MNDLIAMSNRRREGAGEAVGRERKGGKERDKERKRERKGGEIGQSCRHSEYELSLNIPLARPGIVV